MGWLFALALALQERRQRALFVALVPIAIGHAVSLVIVAGAILLLGTIVRPATVELVAACLLLVFGAYKLRTYYRHPRWVGMRVGLRDLGVWSFLMATGHGAGLMVAPALAALSEGPDTMDAMHAPAALMLGVALHTVVMLAVMAIVAWVVYRKLGLRVLRSSWVNFDLIWAVALLVVGALAVAHALWSLRGSPMDHAHTAAHAIGRAVAI